MKSPSDDDAVPGVSCDLDFSEAQMAASGGAGVRREGWQAGMFVVVAYLPSVRMALPLICMDGWLEDATLSMQRYVPSAEDQAACDWEAKKISVHPMQDGSAPPAKAKMN